MRSITALVLHCSARCCQDRVGDRAVAVIPTRSRCTHDTATVSAGCYESDEQEIFCMECIVTLGQCLMRCRACVMPTCVWEV